MEPRRLRLPSRGTSMIGRFTRTLSLTLLSALLALPLAAQPKPLTPRPAPSLLGQIWERLSTPVRALFAAEKTDGRGVWDPDGLTSAAPAGTETDGRGVWDPNG